MLLRCLHGRANNCVYTPYPRRWTKSREKHRARTDTVEIGEIAAKRQRALITSSRATTAPSLPSSRGSRHHLRNRFWVKATDFDD